MVLTEAHREKQPKDFVIKGTWYLVKHHGGRNFI